MNHTKALARLAAKSQLMDNGCINWLGYAHSKTGYAAISIEGTTYSVHRLTCIIYHGEPQDKQHALHSCDNRICINPNHLRWGTHKENMQDKSDRNRNSRLFGESNPRAKLSTADVVAIRKARAEKISIKVLQQKYGISRKAIYFICTKQRWSHVA